MSANLSLQRDRAAFPGLLCGVCVQGFARCAIENAQSCFPYVVVWLVCKSLLDML